MPLFAQNTITAMSHTVLSACWRQRLAPVWREGEASGAYLCWLTKAERRAQASFCVCLCFEWLQWIHHQLWNCYYRMLSIRHLKLLKSHILDWLEKQVFSSFSFSLYNRRVNSFMWVCVYNKLDALAGLWHIMCINWPCGLLDSPTVMHRIFGHIILTLKMFTATYAVLQVLAGTRPILLSSQFDQFITVKFFFFLKKKKFRTVAGNSSHSYLIAKIMKWNFVTCWLAS